MRRMGWFLVLAFASLACNASSNGSVSVNDKEDKEGKGVVVSLDGLRSRTPGTWKEEPPTNRMRFAQFLLPRQKDDKYDAELVIFKGLGGSAKENVKRWKAQFLPPEGKSIDDVAKVEEMQIAGQPATYLDVTGTFEFSAQPFNPNAKKEKRPDYRMLAVHFEGPDNVYHIKLTGPAKTLETYKKGFDDWLKGFKKE